MRRGVLPLTRRPRLKAGVATLSLAGRGAGTCGSTATPLPLWEREGPTAASGGRVRGIILGREDDEDQALGMGRDIIEKQRALPFLGAALAERQKVAKPAVSGAVGRIGEKAWRIFQIEA